jgi:hypothetical protein
MSMMISIRSALVVSLLFALATTPAPGNENEAASEARLRESVTYLASDDLEGRGVGTAGLDRAAEYIASQFAQAGLKTDLFSGTPFQEFEVTVASELGPAEHNRLTLLGPPDASGQPRTIELKLAEAFTPLATGGTGKFDAPLVFAGYGITAKDLKRGDAPFTYDDYAGIDANGKVVILIRKEPQQKDEKSPFDGKNHSQHATFMRKIANASEHGAAAVILVNDEQEVQSRREQKSDAEPDYLLPFTGAGDASTHRKLPVYFCTRRAINPILQAALGKELSNLEQEIDANLLPKSAPLPGWRAAGETNIVERKATVKNVVAVLEGNGPLADETIILGAHYDHLGRGGSGSLAPWTTDIHNGADDNASGAATLIEIARRLASLPDRPTRRIVFIAFTGEERGLLGSAHYTRQPRFPLEKTIAMLNLDMVGRLTEDKLIVYGTGTAKQFDPLVERLSQELGFKLTKQAGGFGPSDHSSFYSKKIPVLHLFTGTHRDYHRPSDDTEKLNFAGMRRISEMLVGLVHAIGAAQQRPDYVEIRRVEQLGEAPGGERPSFGSMPAYPNPVEDGVLLEAVLEGSPAEKAGVKGGDVLIQFGESKITVLEDFESALRKHQPGDRVRVKLRRGQEIIEVEVTLGRRRMQ